MANSYAKLYAKSSVKQADFDEVLVFTDHYLPSTFGRNLGAVARKASRYWKTEKGFEYSYPKPGKFMFIYADVEFVPGGSSGLVYVKRKGDRLGVSHKELPSLLTMHETSLYAERLIVLEQVLKRKPIITNEWLVGFLDSGELRRPVKLTDKAIIEYGAWNEAEHHEFMMDKIVPWLGREFRSRFPGLDSKFREDWDASKSYRAEMREFKIESEAVAYSTSEFTVLFSTNLNGDRELQIYEIGSWKEIASIRFLGSKEFRSERRKLIDYVDLYMNPTPG